MEYRLPNGDTTFDVNDFYAAWDALSVPFEKMGFKLVSYSPGLCFSYGQYGRTFEIPACVAAVIVERLQGVVDVREGV